MRLQPALQRLLVKGPKIRVLLVGTVKAEPGSGPIRPKKWFLFQDQDLSEECVMSNKWFPTKKEIEKWID